MAKMNFSRLSFFFFFINLLEIFVIRTETCPRGPVDRSTGCLTAVGSKIGWRTCGIAYGCAPSRL